MVEVERSFVIADLVGYTAAVDAHGDQTAASLAEALDRAAASSLGPADELIKSMGDAVLVASRTPTDAVQFLRRLYDAVDDPASRLPVLRAGAHHGTAVRRGGDYFGSGVNLAARVADLSSGCQVLATSEVARAARELHIEVVELGPFELRNVAEPIDLFEVSCGHDVRGHVIDPVCRMRVPRTGAAGSARVAGREHLFCSLECLHRFTEDPQRYLRDA